MEAGLLLPSQMQALDTLLNFWENPKLCSLEFGGIEKPEGKRQLYKERGPNRRSCTSINDRATWMMPQKVVGLEPSWKDDAQDLPTEVNEAQQKKTDWDKLPKDRSQGSIIQNQRKCLSTQCKVVFSRVVEVSPKDIKTPPERASLGLCYKEGTDYKLTTDLGKPVFPFSSNPPPPGLDARRARGNAGNWNLNLREQNKISLSFPTIGLQDEGSDSEE